MSFEETYDLIEKYLNNTLTMEERSVVEIRLTQDASFREDVEAHRAANNLVVDGAVLDIKNQLQRIHTESTGKQNKFKQKFYYLIAAVLVGTSIGIVLLFTSKNEDKPVRDTIVTESSDKNISSHNSVQNKDGSDQVVKNNSGAINITNDDIHSAANENTGNSEQKNISNGITANEENNSKPGNVSAKNENSTEANTPKNNPVNDIAKNVPSESSKCVGITIDFSFSVTKTCNGQKNGEIVFDPASPDISSLFEFSIDGGKTFSSKTRFSNLAAGEYQLVVRDEQNCKSKLQVASIEKDNCDYVIYPQRQQYWEVPLEKFAGETVILKITDGRTGRIVFQEMLSGSAYTWNGADENGSQLPMGNYVYELSVSNNTDFPVIKGNVTIVW